MRRGLPFAAMVLLSALAFLAVPKSALSQAPSRADSRAAWNQIVTVLQHPRCLNCHQKDSPLQGDSRRLHIPMVVRGPENHGVGAMQCNGCHNESGNNNTSRTPGAPHWSLAPASMLWQGLSSAQLCRALKNSATNGNRTLAQIVDHMGTDKLVLWGWDPGTGRAPVPIPHAEFMQQLRIWVDGGAVCP